MKSVFKILLAFFVCIILNSPVLSAEDYSAALKTLGVWIQESRLRLDINLWYPTLRAPKELNFSPWVLHAAPNAPPIERKFPLIIISHDSSGSRFSYHDTASWLAAQGYIVAAPTHPADSIDNMDSLFTAGQLLERMENIDAAIELIKNDRELGKHVDEDAIGLIGYGAGGAASLFMGGAMPDCESWPAWCKKGKNKNPYCANSVKEKIDKMCLTFQKEKFTKKNRIKAIVIISPAYGMLFGKNSFMPDFPPVLIVAANRDNVNYSEMNSEFIGRLLGAKAHYMEMPSADMGSLLASCPPSLAQELPELCFSVEENERKKIHRNINNALKMFFSANLGMETNR